MPHRLLPYLARANEYERLAELHPDSTMREMLAGIASRLRELQHKTDVSGSSVRDAASVA
jgi:hypothetical protein